MPGRTISARSRVQRPVVPALVGIKAAHEVICQFNTGEPFGILFAVATRNQGTQGIPMRHGYPLRTLIPGRYGEENPKWLTRVELTDHFVGGLYADQGWYNGPLHTTTRTDRPTGHIPFSSSIQIGGIAFAGNRGIEKVEVSVDGGASWNSAKLDPPLSQDSWVLWTWEWTPLLPGRYTLVARSADGTGELQTSKKTGTVPGGSTGYHTITVQVG